MRIAIVIFVLFLNDEVSCGLADFFKDMASDIGSAFSDTWQTMRENIVRPVRIRRLGSGGKKKSTTEATTRTTTLHTEFPKEITTERKNVVRLSIPWLPTPAWKAIGDWKPQDSYRFSVRRQGAVKQNLFRPLNNRTPEVLSFEKWMRMQKTIAGLKEGEAKYICYFVNSKRRTEPTTDRDIDEQTMEEVTLNPTTVVSLF